MTLALVLLSIAVVLLATTVTVGGAAAHRTIRRLRAHRDASGLQALVGCRVVANVAEGPAIRGVLEHVYRDALVLAHPEYVGAARPQNIGTHVTLMRSEVPMLQRFEEPALAAVDANAGG